VLFCLQVLSAAGCELVGGHSSEGTELSAGKVITQPLCRRQLFMGVAIGVCRACAHACRISHHVKPENVLKAAGLKPGGASLSWER
jgi:hypothetical protein